MTDRIREATLSINMQQRNLLIIETSHFEPYCRHCKVAGPVPGILRVSVGFGSNQMLAEIPSGDESTRRPGRQIASSPIIISDPTFVYIIG